MEGNQLSIVVVVVVADKQHERQRLTMDDHGIQIRSNYGTKTTIGHVPMTWPSVRSILPIKAKKRLDQNMIEVQIGQTIRWMSYPEQLGERKENDGNMHDRVIGLQIQWKFIPFDIITAEYLIDIQLQPGSSTRQQVETWLDQASLHLKKYM